MFVTTLAIAPLLLPHEVRFLCLFLTLSSILHLSHQLLPYTKEAAA
jgi:hypothetical protein